jgi:hypothetical protein
MSSQNDDLVLTAIVGDTYSRVVRWADGDVLVKKAITGITRARIAVITAVGNGLQNGWPFTIQSVVGMMEINNVVLETNENGAPKSFGTGANGKLTYEASAVTADTVSLNDVNSLDFTAYSSGGVIIYETPKSLAGLTAKMMFKSDPDDVTALVTLINTDGIVIDDSAKTIIFTLSSARSTTLGTGVFYFDLQLTDAGGIVTTIVKGTLTLTKQTTT